MTQPSPTRTRDRQRVESPIDDSPEKRAARVGQNRTPVISSEIRFIRQRLEGEPVSELRDVAINALGILERAYATKEKRA